MPPVAKNSKSAASARAQTGGGMQRFFAKGPVSAPASGGAQAPASVQPAVAAVTTPQQPPVAAAVIAGAPTPALAPAPGSQLLTEEQRQRIAENRRRALERQQQKLVEQPVGSAPQAANGPVGGPPQAPGAPAVTGSAQATSPPQATIFGAAPGSKRKQPATKPAAAPKAKVTKTAARASVEAQSLPAKSPTRFSAADPSKITTPPRSATPKDSGSDSTPEKESSPPIYAACGPGPAYLNCGMSRFAGLGHNAVWQQYDWLYASRLCQMRSFAVEEAKRHWSSELSPGAFLDEISSFKQGGDASRPVVLTGVIIRDYKSRANVVEECRRAMTEGSRLLDSTACISSQNDTLWLEDSTMRVELVAPDDVAGRLATGIVVSVKAIPSKDGKIHVQEFCFPCPLTRPPSLPSSTSNPRFIALISGLHFGDSNVASNREQLGNFLTGRPSSVTSVVDGAQLDPGSVCRVVMCGGLLATTQGQAMAPADSQAALVEADAFLARLCAAVPVDLMPGKADPTGAALPQAALSPLLFKSLRSCRDFKAVGNPYEADLGGLRLLGHSGTPVEDLIRCTVDVQDPLSALQLTLQARHLAPTAPDTLTTQPLAKGERDPFVIGTAGAEAAPHVLFSGGHSEPGYRWCPLPEPGNTWASGRTAGGVATIAVPAFHACPAAILVNVNDPADVRIFSLQRK